MQNRKGQPNFFKSNFFIELFPFIVDQTVLVNYRQSEFIKEEHLNFSDNICGKIIAAKIIVRFI